MKTGSLELVTRGQPRARISISKQSPTPVRFAASEIQRYLREMSGADLPVTRGGASDHELVIAKTGLRFSRTDRTKTGLKSKTNSDTYQISITPKSLVIRGNSAAAV